MLAIHAKDLKMSRFVAGLACGWQKNIQYESTKCHLALNRTFVLDFFLATTFLEWSQWWVYLFSSSQLAGGGKKQCTQHAHVIALHMHKVVQGDKYVHIL